MTAVTTSNQRSMRWLRAAASVAERGGGAVSRGGSDAGDGAGAASGAGVCISDCVTCSLDGGELRSARLWAPAPRLVASLL
jgi:hypothetical protein